MDKENNNNKKEFKKRKPYKPLTYLKVAHYQRPENWKEPLSQVTLETKNEQPKTIEKPDEKPLIQQINNKYTEINKLNEDIDKLYDQKNDLRKKNIEELKSKSNENRENFSKLNEIKDELKSVTDKIIKFNEIKDKYNKQIDNLNHEKEELLKKTNQKTFVSAEKLNEKIEIIHNYINDNKLKADEENKKVAEITKLKAALKNVPKVENINTTVKELNDKRKEETKGLKQLLEQKKDLNEQKKLVKQKIDEVKEKQAGTENKTVKKTFEEKHKRELTKGELDVKAKIDQKREEIKKKLEEINKVFDEWSKLNEEFQVYLTQKDIYERTIKIKERLYREANKEKLEKEYENKLIERLKEDRKKIEGKIEKRVEDIEDLEGFINGLKLKIKKYNSDNVNKEAKGEPVTALNEEELKAKIDDDNLVLMPSKKKETVGVQPGNSKLKKNKNKKVKANEGNEKKHPLVLIKTDFESINSFRKAGIEMPNNEEELETCVKKLSEMKDQLYKGIEEELKEFDTKFESGEMLKELKERNEKRRTEKRQEREENNEERRRYEKPNNKPKQRPQNKGGRRTKPTEEYVVKEEPANN